jgi:hypothetical protein
MVAMGCPPADLDACDGKKLLMIIQKYNTRRLGVVVKKRMMKLGERREQREETGQPSHGPRPLGAGYMKPSCLLRFQALKSLCRIVTLLQVPRRRGLAAAPCQERGSRNAQGPWRRFQISGSLATESDHGLCKRR